MVFRFGCIDGTQFYTSKHLSCEGCLVKQHKKSSPTYSHQVLQGGIAHPDCSEVIPFMPEHIVNTDGATKQDCEMKPNYFYKQPSVHQTFLLWLQCNIKTFIIMVMAFFIF